MATIRFIEPRELGPKDWGTETLIVRTADYSGKILRMRAGSKGPLQYHEWKDEAFHLFTGEAIVRWPRYGFNELDAITLTPGQTVHVPPGAVHQVEAVTDCVLFEVSNPVFDDRVNVEKDYDQP